MNVAAWMIAGGPQIETRQSRLEREQLHAFRESRRVVHEDDPGILERIRSFVRPESRTAEPVCCPA